MTASVGFQFHISIFHLHVFISRRSQNLPDTSHKSNGNAIVAVLLYLALLLQGGDAVPVAGVFAKVEHLLPHSTEVAGSEISQSAQFRKIIFRKLRLEETLEEDSPFVSALPPCRGADFPK